MYPSGCEYDGTIYAYSESFPSADGCSQCTCLLSGDVACTEPDCQVGCEYLGKIYMPGWEGLGRREGSGGGFNYCFCIVYIVSLLSYILYRLNFAVCILGASHTAMYIYIEFIECVKMILSSLSSKQKVKMMHTFQSRMNHTGCEKTAWLCI